MNKAYSRINFQNAPSTATPLNATNLNKMDKAINDLDDRIIELSGYQEEAEESAEMASASASAAAKAAETATADAEARVNEVIQGLEVYTKADSHKKFASVIKQVATGSPILIKDSSDAGVLDFKAYGKSVQDGEPTPDSPVDIVSVGDGGYFDGELLNGYYNSSTGEYVSQASGRICSKNPIPCKSGDVVKIVLENNVSNMYICYYGENGYISMLYGTENTNFIEKTIPNGATYFTFWAVNSGMTVDTVGHITVTINGKYALIVKSRGKNLFNAHNLISYDTANGSIDIDDIKGTITLTGTYYHGTSIEVEPNTDYYLNYYVESKTVNDQVSIWDDRTSELLKMGSGLFNSGNCTKIRLYLYSGKDTSGTTVYKNFQFERNTVATDYKPYKETVTYIPLNEPIRSSLDGTVTDEASLSENKVTRRIVRKRIVTVSKNDSTDVNNYCYYCTLGNVGRSNRGMSNNLPNLSVYELSINGTENIGQHVSVEYGGVVYINVGKLLTENTVEGMTKWLSENPTYIQYELAEPIVETIEPVDIVTYDNVTYLTASDNAEMEVTYATDTKSYIDSKFAALHAALVNML